MHIDVILLIMRQYVNCDQSSTLASTPFDPKLSKLLTR